MPKYETREEMSGDEAGIRQVETLAFGRPDEAALVARLRDGEGPMLSMVAIHREVAGPPSIIGHVLFTAVKMESDAEARPSDGASMALGPVAVLPDRQGQGIGAALIRAGLERLAAYSAKRVFVLGHPTYYPRFGFAAAWEWGCYFESAELEPHFMALALEPEALSSVSGLVVYRPEFYEM